MHKYKKIKSVWDRDPDNDYNTFIEGSWAKPEFELLQNAKWYWTEKIHGTNIRIIWGDGRVIIKGRREKSEVPDFLREKLEEIFPVEKFKENEMNAMCLYGEGFGDGIQDIGDKYISDDCSFILFDIKIGDWWLKREDIEDIANTLNINIVPILHIGSLWEAIDLVKEGFQSTIAEEDLTAEGLVLKPTVQLFNRAGERVITKIKHKDFIGD